MTNRVGWATALGVAAIAVLATWGLFALTSTPARPPLEVPPGATGTAAESDAPEPPFDDNVRVEIELGCVYICDNLALRITRDGVATVTNSVESGETHQLTTATVEQIVGAFRKHDFAHLRRRYADMQLTDAGAVTLTLNDGDVRKRVFADGCDPTAKEAFAIVRDVKAILAPEFKQWQALAWERKAAEMRAAVAARQRR